MSKYVQSKYIQDLVTNLIGKNHFDKFYGDEDSLLYTIKEILLSDDVRLMRPETLGRIMCSFEIGEVMSAHPIKELGELGFNGDCEDLLRELVSLCLAHVIRDRLLEAGSEEPDPLEQAPDRTHYLDHLGR